MHSNNKDLCKKPGFIIMMKPHKQMFIYKLEFILFLHITHLVSGYGVWKPKLRDFERDVWNLQSHVHVSNVYTMCDHICRFPHKSITFSVIIDFFIHQESTRSVWKDKKKKKKQQWQKGHISTQHKHTLLLLRYKSSVMVLFSCHLSAGLVCLCSSVIG